MIEWKYWEKINSCWKISWNYFFDAEIWQTFSNYKNVNKQNIRKKFHSNFFIDAIFPSPYTTVLRTKVKIFLKRVELLFLISNKYIFTTIYYHYKL